MNDRYLYRAKRTDNGEWVEGSLITGVFFLLGQDIPYILCPDKADYDCFEDFSEENGIFEVDPSTICQCTGLRDKNGKLILENDIVSANGTLYVCRFDEDNFEWEFQNREETIGICCFHSSDIEITGNAIDNPELLEVGE